MNSYPAHRPRKRFGQHFLHERGVIDRILLAIDPKPNDLLVEIGPGEGALTLPLLAHVGRLLAIEIDRDLAALLPKRAAGLGELTVIEADALCVDFRALAAGRRLRLIGNLPYNISTPLLFHLLGVADVITDMHFMLQKEVVDRMAAGPGSKDYGRLSVMLKARAEVAPLFRVAPGAFRPPPKVDSAVVRIVPKPADAIADIDAARLERIVRAAFAKRRKTLNNALAGIVEDAELRVAGIDPRMRAEDVPVEGYLALAGRLSRPTP
jgi:16S rRNA (adenine1518-N6/adenine1519-N6)-dimethyltransferase